MAHFRFRFLLVILATLTVTPCGASADDSLERTVKAAFLYKFGRFVEWPAAAFVTATSPFNLCIVGNDPFGATLDKVAEGELINGHSIVIHRLKTVARNSGCHILYIDKSEPQLATQVIEEIRGSSVLTVSDADTSKSGKGIIDFVIADNRVRFNIDEEAAAKNDLVISSKLLNLALNVKHRAAKENR